MTDMPPLPDFLNRKLWSKEQMERAEAARKRLIEAQRKEILKAEREARERFEQAKAEKAEAAQRRAERKATTLAREEKKRVKAKTLSLALTFALENGKVTAMSLEKSLPPEFKRYAKWALKTLVNQGRLSRPSKKVYTL